MNNSSSSASLWQRLIDWTVIFFALFRLIVPVIQRIFNSLPVQQFHWLDLQVYSPKFQNFLYIQGFIIYFALLCTGIYLFYKQKKLDRIICLIQRPLVYTTAGIILGVSNIFSYEVVTLVFAVSAISLYLFQIVYKKPLPFLPISIILTFVFIRHVVPQIIAYDSVFPQKDYLLTYRWIGLPAIIVIWTGILGYFFREKLFHIWNRIPSKSILFAILAAIITVITILPRFSDCPPGNDVYFTMMPAYHVLNGGVLYTNAISQYGLGYIFPWVFILWLFPSLPLSFLAGAFITFVLLCIFFAGVGYISEKLYTNPMVSVGVICSSIFYTILIRYYNFTDPYIYPKFPLTCGPAFTPLRYDIFVIPLIFLIAAVRKKSNRLLKLFVVVSSLIFFYSMDFGMPAMLVGVFCTLVYAATEKTRRYLVPGIILWSGTVLIGSGLLYGIWSVVRTGKLPDVAMYSLFTKMFASGFNSVALAGNTTIVVSLVIAIVGLLSGIELFFAQKKESGIIYIYLSLILFAQHVYYLNRAVPPNLYSSALAMIFLIGMLVEEIKKVNFLKPERVFLTSVSLGGALLLIIGICRTTLVITTEWRNPVETAGTSVQTVMKVLSTWEIKNRVQYSFLKQNLPANCKIIMFDRSETELMTSLHLQPAFEYQFLRYYFAAGEQIDDMLQRHPGGYCVFINVYEQSLHLAETAQIYNYLWPKLLPKAKLIAVSGDKAMELYYIEK